MKRQYKRLLILIFVFMLSVSHTMAYASSYEVDRLKKEHQEAQEQVEAIDKQKKEAESAANDLKETASKLNSEIKSLNGQISSVATEINSTELLVEDVEEDIEQLLAQLEETIAKKELQDESMRKRIQYMYENKSTSILVNLVESGSLSEFMQRLEYMAAITKYDKNAIANYKNTQQAIEQTKSLVEEKYKDLSEYQLQLEEKKSSLDELVSKNAGILSNTKAKLADTKSIIEELEEQLKEAKKKEADLQDAYMDAQNSYAQSLAGYSEYTGGSFDGYSQEEMMLLAALVQAEADNQGDDGRAAVASVIMNRVFSSKFPNSIAGVIFANNQFAPVASGRVALILAQGPNQNCQRAAIDALGGARRTSALFFCTYSYAQMRHNQQVEAGEVGMLDRTYGEVIGAHYFYNY